MHSFIAAMAKRFPIDLAITVGQGRTDDRTSKIGDCDLMMRIDVAGERRERSVRHPNRESRRMLGRIRHRQEQNLQARLLRKRLRKTIARETAPLRRT